MCGRTETLVRSKISMALFSSVKWKFLTSREFRSFRTSARLVPLVFTKVLSDKDGAALGRLDLLCDEEPIDVIDRFIQSSVLAAVYGDKASLSRYNILQEVCEEVFCTRSTPVVYKKTINDINGTALGTVEVFEFEEVVDSVVHFLADTNA